MITTRTIIDLLTAEMEETEILFDSPLQIKTTPHHHLMDINGVSVDAAGKLWIKNARHNWTQVTDNLMYASYINGSLFQRLKLLHIMSTELSKPIKKIISQ